MDERTEIKKKLLYLYEQQTQEEQYGGYTIENNSRGFNGVDASFCSSLAEWVLNGKPLTDKQLLSLKYRIPKYKRQFENGEWMHVQVPATKENGKRAKQNTLDIDPRTGGLVFSPVTYPSKQIRDLAPFRWDGEDKAWVQTRPNVNKSLVQKICKMFPNVQVTEELEKALNPPQVELPEEIKEHEQLFPFQKETIQFMLTHKKVLLGLAPGLGKTACAIFAGETAKRYQHSIGKEVNVQRILVISPLSLVQNWKNEIKKWSDGIAEIVYKQDKPSGNSKWYITNYDTVRLNQDNFMYFPWDIIIVDESIMIKNRKAKRTKTIKDLVTKIKPEYVWLLSGAPVSRLYDDMWSQLHIIDPARFSSYWRFTGNYCYVEQNQWGWQIIANRPDAAERIQGDLEDVYFSRTQDQVLNLPDWIFDNVYIQMDEQQDKIYGQMEDQFVAQLPDGNVLLAPNVLAQLIRLVQLASNPILVGGKNNSAKWAAVKEMLEYETLPAIIWTSFIETAEQLKVRLEDKYRVAVLTGATKTSDRQDIVDKFQAGELDVIIAHPGVGKFGFTLTAARTAIYLERSFNGDDYYQSLHRVRRIGTKYAPHVIHLISVRKDGRGTVDNVIDKVLQSRRENVLKLTAGELKTMFKEQEE